MCQNSHFPIFNHARGWEMTMRQKLTMCVVEFLAHFHVRVRECARTGTFLLLLYCRTAISQADYSHIIIALSCHFPLIKENGKSTLIDEHEITDQLNSHVMLCQFRNNIVMLVLPLVCENSNSKVQTYGGSTNTF